MPKSNHQLHLDLDAFNSICYELAGDIDLLRKAWVIPALKSHVRYICELHNYRIYDHVFDKLFENWIGVRQGKLNPVPRSLP